MRVQAAGYGRGIVTIDDPGLDAFLMEPRELVERFQAPSYRPPVLPSVALELHELTRRRLCDMRQVVRLLERDPMVAGRVLRMAQSARYATRVPVGSLEEALGRLGLETLSQIVLEVTLGMTLFRVRGYEAPMERVRKHSTATAYLARAVARAAKQPMELAFMGGLLHDIGVVACLLVFGQPAGGARMPTFDEAWSVIAPIHEEVSGLLARLWKLPDELQAALAQHHHADPASALARTLFVADAIATRLGLGLEHEPDALRFDDARRRLGLTDALMPELLDYAAKVIAQID